MPCRVRVHAVHNAPQRVYKTTFMGRACIVKERFPKKYRQAVAPRRVQAGPHVACRGPGDRHTNAHGARSRRDGALSWICCSAGTSRRHPQLDAKLTKQRLNQVCAALEPSVFMGGSVTVVVVVGGDNGRRNRRGRGCPPDAHARETHQARAERMPCRCHRSMACCRAALRARSLVDVCQRCCPGCAVTGGRVPTVQETRQINKCKLVGIPTPNIYHVDVPAGRIYLEFLEVGLPANKTSTVACVPLSAPRLALAHLSLAHHGPPTLPAPHRHL